MNLAELPVLVPCPGGCASGLVPEVLVWGRHILPSTLPAPAHHLPLTPQCYAAGGGRASIASSHEMDDFVEHLTRISNQVAVAQQVLHTPLAPITRKSGIKAAFKRFGRKMGSLS